MKTFEDSLLLRTRENIEVFITLDENINGIHYKRVNILCLAILKYNMITTFEPYIYFQMTLLLE